MEKLARGLKGKLGIRQIVKEYMEREKV